METALRPLGIVMELVAGLDHEVTYAYDDLVFIDHNDFLLQFSADPNTLDLFFNTECSAEEADAIASGIIPEALKVGLTIRRKGAYSISEAAGESLHITFHA